MARVITAAGGSAADPPHKGHLAVLRKLFTSGLFDRIIWIISGDRQDKHFNVCTNDRIAMTELMIPRAMRTASSPDLVVLYDDIYQINTPTITLLEDILPKRFPNDDFFWYTGSDSVMPKEEFKGKCEIEAKWIAGRRLYRHFPFVVIERGRYPLAGVKLPSNITVLSGALPEIASSQIRKLIAESKKFEHLLPKAVADYIKRHGLYGYKEKTP